MDERHWWLAGKIQESFHIGGGDPALLEDFLCEPNILEVINGFFRTGAQQRVFFYCNASSGADLTIKDLHLTESLTELGEYTLEEVTVLYFLKHDASVEIDPAHIERDIFCGELKGNTIEGLNSMLGDVFLPILKAQRDWGECTSDTQSILLHNMEKFITGIQETSSSTHTRQWMLRQPESTISSDFKQHRLAASDQNVISQYEELVTDWMTTIEAILHDTSDERFMDPNAGPLSELERWKRRQRLLTSITEQLKSKDCKAVIGVLITAKSRLLKKWKLIDAGITDAMNETKDKVKYMESLRRHLDQLYNGATPASTMNVALPGLVHAIKQMDSISRFYSRQGFLGLLFTKVTNQLVLACKDYVKESTILEDGTDILWRQVEQEVQSSEELALNTDPLHRHFRSLVENRMKSQRLKGREIGKGGPLDGESLIGRLRACLTLQSYYRDCLRTLRDSLGASSNLSHFPSLSSLGGPAGSMTGRSKMGTGSRPRRPSVSTSPSKKTPSLTGDHEGHGVPIGDEDTIMSHMDAFCSRIRQLLDVINTVAQFHRMKKTTSGLPRPRKEDLVYDESKDPTAKISLEDQTQAEPVRPAPALDHGNLGAIAEDEEILVEEAQQQSTEGADGQVDEVHAVLNTQTGLTREDLKILKKYYPDHRRGDGPSITGVVQEHYIKMIQIMTDAVTTKTMLDVESKDRDRFEDIYTTFLLNVQDLEKFLAAYLHAVFARKMTTQEALDLMIRFVPIQQRPGIRIAISEKFIEIFNWYESDLDEIQQVYEKNKEDPPLLRNAPPVAGAINWSRQLLTRIEEPMKVFRENKAITNLKDFSRIVKIYNRLATTLVTFESLWFTHWKSHIDQAKNGLRATLFVQNPDTGQIMVNADERVLQLIHEARWLTRLGIQIPESAMMVMQQEARFKGYKDHLQLCLRDFNDVCNAIPPALYGLFEKHIEAARANFHPGLSTLAWNSMNIDAFLHQVHAGTERLKYLVTTVNAIVASKVQGTIDTISNMLLFNHELAFSRSWPPHEFTSAMVKSVRQQGEKLYNHVTAIETGIKEIAGLLTRKQALSYAKLRCVLKALKKWQALVKRRKAERAAKGIPEPPPKPASRGHKKDRKTSLKETTMYISDISTSHTAKTSQNEENMISELLSHYCDEIYQAILMATTRSLVTLAESSGCTGEVIRAASAMSNAPSRASSSPSPRPSTASPRRSHSALSNEAVRPMSILSMLSDMTWTTELSSEATYLHFEVAVKFSIPDILIEPPLVTVQTAVNTVATNILAVAKGVSWLGGDNLGELFFSRVQEEDAVDEIRDQLSTVVDDLQSIVKQHLHHFSMYDFLWKDDMRGNYYDFIRHEPGIPAIKREVERLLRIEKKVLAIPMVLPVGPICLNSEPIKDALQGFAMTWKNLYASVLHEEAKKKLDAAVLYRSNVRQRLELNVTTLDQLNSSLHLLEELRDMENKIDDIYLPIETMYEKLREFELRLPRKEVQEVDMLREHWQDLLVLAEEVRYLLMKEKRVAFEQELDKQIKTFVVEVIQFRNAFDAQGPAVPGIPPAEAVSRLHDFQQRYALYDTKRNTLDSVSKLFGIPCKPFPELDKTGEELELLGMLYGLFQKFLRFDTHFRDTLWAEVDLDASTSEVESYWDECLALPSKLKDWDAYNDMKGAIQAYLDVFPLLHKLASKREQRYGLKEIRNRHWLQVMSVTGSSFQLEANVFRLSHLLDIGLIKHKKEIEEICWAAGREQELEVKMRVTEDEWTEQVLNFEHYKRRGPMYLDKVSTERLLEQLEDAQALLAQMLTSRYIGPLREEAASWAEKLKEVGEVLEQWLEVQDLWQYLEAVFSNPDAAKELPQEAKRFARIDKGWTKMMKRAYDTRNVLQCCYGGEVPKGMVLRHIFEELEVCFKSLTSYLDGKRRTFPRFFFVTDPVLLAILSRPNDLESVRPHLRTLFASVHDVELVKQNLSDGGSDIDDRPGTRTPGLSHTDRGRSSSGSPHVLSDTPRIDKRLAQIHKRSNNINPGVVAAQQISTMLPSEGLMEEVVAMDAMAVSSIEGEILKFEEKVPLSDGVEVWLGQLQSTISETLHEMVLSVINDVNQGIACDEWAHKYPAQVCRIALLHYWTRECEQGIAEIKFERRALNNTAKKFGVTMNKLPTVLMRGAWKTLDDPMTAVHKLRLESIITQSLFLRDSLDSLSNRKLRENTDFEWRRCIRFYVQDHAGKPEPLIHILDQTYKYSCEFYGAQPQIGLTPLTERCFLSMSQAIAACKGGVLCGGTGVGKTETVKGFAQIVGKFIAVHQCSLASDPGALGRIMHGMAMDGCWVCFDDVQLLPPAAVSVLLHHLQVVFTALKAVKDYCVFTDGQEVSLKKNVAMFMTWNPATSPAGYELPSDVRANFRQVALTKPDYSLVLKAKVSACGLKNPTVLAMRLKTVADLVKAMLPDSLQSHFSIANLSAVLHRASQRRRYLREERSLDKIEKSSDKKDQDSRSNSQVSMAPTVLMPVTHQSSTNIATVGMQKPSRKSGTSSNLSSAAKMEHAIVAQCLLDVVGPRLTAEISTLSPEENHIIFKQIVKDVFSGLPEPPSSVLAMSAKSRSQDVESAIETTAQEKGLVPHKPWMDKAMQLYAVSQVQQGIILAGPPGSGKSTVLQCLVDALCVNPRGMGSRQTSRSASAHSDMSETNHKLLKMNPLVVDDLSLMFGQLNQNHDWVDGIFTTAWKKANRSPWNQATTWLCLDGPLLSSWADSFSSVLDSGKVLQLKNGDQLFLSNNVRLIFETDDISSSSPATISRAGIVYVDKTVVGWQPIAKSWLEHRTQQEVRVLQRAFQKTVDAVSQYVISECRPKLRLCEVGMFKTCIDLLSAMLADNKEIAGELHIERLYLFCLIWSFGGLLEEKERRGFSDLLITLSTALPDDDRAICVFDYYVDESGEWDPWQSRVPEAVYSDHQNLLGEVFIDTVDTIRTHLFMEFAAASGQNVLLVGPPGSGKTAMINDFMDTQDQQAQVTKRLVFSGASTAKQLQQFVEANIYHRQGFVYGAKENKRLQVFIDDVNLPSPDEQGVQRCNELLRQMLDDKVLCTLQRPFEWHTIEGLVIFSAMCMSDYPSMSCRGLSPRLLRHFAVLNLPAAQNESLKNVVNGVLEATMHHGEKPGLELDLHENIVSASCQALAEVQRVLRPSPLPGRRHYIFTVKDLVTCFQCLKRLPDESRADETMVVSLWSHELKRIIRDRICRFADLQWFDELMSETIQEHWPQQENLHDYFVTFPTDHRTYQRPVTTHSKKEVKVALQPIDRIQDIHACLQAHLTRYNEEFGNIHLDIMLSENVLSHLVKMHRVLSFHHSANFLLVGQIGSHLATLCKLALHVANIPIHSIDSSKHNNFFDGLRSALRVTGSEGKMLTILFTARDLEEEVYLDAVNSLLVCGEYPHLFSNDEMEGLLLALGPALKREHPGVSIDLMKFFVSRVKTNLRILICLPPGHKLLRLAASHYPGLLSGCQMIWMCDWPQESLMCEAEYFVRRHSLTDDCENKLSAEVVNCLANIHSFALKECCQIPWAGDMSEEIEMTQVKVHEKKKDQLRTAVIKQPNRPYSKAVMLEMIKQRHRDASTPGVNEVYVGPTTYKRFMNTFKYIYKQKAEERTNTVNRLKKVLSTLEHTRKDAKNMREQIKHITKKYESSKEQTATLLQQLTARATVLEKLKAKAGISTSLSAFLQLNELSEEEEEEDDLLKSEERDEYDDEFDKKREANLKTRQVKAKEDHATAVKKVEECREQLAASREQVLHWKSRVDRPCVERLKGFQNPTMLVGQVMEMVMVLIGKKSPHQRIEIREQYPSKEDQSGRFSTSSTSTRMTQAKRAKGMKEGSDRFDRHTWKNMQQTMNDTMKFVDMLHNVPWEDGLSNDVLNAVESYLARGTDGQLGVTGEGTLLENASEKEKAFVAQRRSPSPDNTRGITIANAKYSSEDAATLVQYTIAIVEYTRLCGPLKASLEKVQELEREIEENERLQRDKEAESEEEEGGGTEEQEDDLTEDDLPRIQAEVNDLQAQFDGSVVEKHNLESELESMNERLKAASDVLESLKGQEGDWKGHVKAHSSNDTLIANCITAAAFMIYCGPLSTDLRMRMGEFFQTICKHHKIPEPTRLLFRDLQLIDFLYKPLLLRELEQLELPLTPLMLENAVFVMQEDSTLAWPLLCDPVSRVINWIGDYMKDKQLVEVRYHELRSQLETCLSEGLPLLVTDCDMGALNDDPRFLNVILQRNRFVHGRQPFKIWVGDHEVECQPHFRLYLHTTTLPHLVPRELAAYLTVIYFHQTRSCIEEQLLDRFMAHEKSRLNDEKRALLQERLENMHQMTHQEEQMLKLLSSDVRLLQDLPSTKHLAELKKQYDETIDNQSRVDTSEEAIQRARESYRTISQRGAVCFDAAQYLREISPVYQISFTQFLDIFDTAISHSERAAIKAVVDRLTWASYVTTARALCERDRLIFSLLLALEVHDSQGCVGQGEREYLISPGFGALTMKALGCESTDSKLTMAKKPFDWMLDTQFQNLQLLAVHYEWFQEMFDRMPKDGRETQWRNLCESELPESAPLPDKNDETYTPLQRLLVLRAVRNDRLLQACTMFITSVLGKKYQGELAVDLSLLLKQSTPQVPILLLYRTERESAEKLFTEFANRKQSRTMTVTLSGSGLPGERAIRKFLQTASREGIWLLLQNGHSAPGIMSLLETMLAELTQVDPNFRCWVTAEVTSDLPVRLLQATVKLMVDTPRTMKETMIRSFSWIESDMLKQTQRSEWPVFLHNLCFLHAAVRLRARMGRAGWTAPQDFLHIGNNEFFEALNFASNEFRDNMVCVGPDGFDLPRSTSWTGIKYMVAEIIYGNYITDTLDQNAVTGMVEYWLSPNAVKKDFELSRLKYKAPAVFQSQHPRLNQLIQALEALPAHHLDVPEACNIHSSPESLLGDDQYIFTRLNKVFDAMPATNTLTHQLFPRPPTPFDGPAISNVSGTSNSPVVVDMGVVATATHAALRTIKETELWEICHTMLPKVPKVYSKDFIADRIRKIGGLTIFNLFIQRELDMMYRLLTEIKTTLQCIKTAAELNTLGDQLSEDMLAAADDLFHGRIPRTWYALSGDTAPPPTMGVSTFLVDLQARCQHFEKILALGREKMPAYWLGAFFYPQGLLAQVKQECYRKYTTDRSGNFEPFVFQTELTARDKDHLRDPPQEGMFVHGVYIWGCAWEKTTGDLQDAPSRHTCTALPVIHVTCWPQSEKPVMQDPNRAAEVYSCSVFQSRLSCQEPIMEIDLRHEGIPATRWSLRGLMATVRPY